MTTVRISGGVVHALPTDLRKALASDAKALAAWEDITPLARNEWICWTISVKKDETRQQHVERVKRDEEAVLLARVNATASVPGAFSYLPAIATVLDAGPHTLSVTFTPTDQVDYSTASESVSILVNQATPTITWPASAAITYGTALSSTQLNATASVQGTLIYSPAAGTVLKAGTQTLKASFTPANATDYGTAEASSTLIVKPAQPSITVSSSAATAFLSNPVTLTATVAFSYGAPTGTVSFMDGTASLGTGTLNGGVATITTSSLPVGSHAVTAIYSGDSNFSAGTSAAFTENIFDFTFGPGSGSSTTATVSRGGTAIYTLAITPPNGSTTPLDITFSSAGLPIGATAIFSPATLPKNSAATNVQLSVSLPVSAVSQVPRSHIRRDAPFLLAFMLLPLLATRRIRRAIGSKAFVGVLFAAGILSGAAMNGCGGNSNSAKTQAPQPQTYTLTITANAGTLAHTTNLTLTVQ